MSKLDPWYTARDFMVRAVEADLHGTDDDRLLDEPPLDRFIVGILHPRDLSGGNAPAEVANEEPDVEAVGSAGADASFDPAVSFAHLRYPASMGLTIGVDGSCDELSIDVRAVRYEAEAAADLTDDEVGTRSADHPEVTWHAVNADRFDLRVPMRAGLSTLPVADGLELRCVIRALRGRVRNVTLVLVNTMQRPAKSKADAYAWFRPQLIVKTIGGYLADRKADGLSSAHLDDDEVSASLLYQHHRSLAVGHGVAVDWDQAEHVAEVRTTYFPRHDLLLAEAERRDDEQLGSLPSLSMDALASSVDFDVLNALVSQYRRWIAVQRGLLKDVPADLIETAENHLERAAEAAVRMETGIGILRTNPAAASAFKAMNSAMAEQRRRQEMIRAELHSPPEVPCNWRPFQLAFVLLNLEGLVDPGSDDRKLADVLWFPTGGGKTEAYLGLIAFTLVLRRLQARGADKNGAGVGVIMRYTLRLLTLQQFERAAGLICALESARIQGALGDVEPFSIGLWVGQGATPNTVANAAKALRKRRNGEEAGELGDPVQLLRCPWCGARLRVDDYRADQQRDQLVVSCPHVECEFRHGLPVHLVDTDIYAAKPSLLIGTVDKFAMLSWNERAGRLFGSGHDAPPDLIVQDELHLISGPLGTLVGLYETAIDHLATDPDTHARPKIVASTATIRRASAQVRAVFDREARQFPPPGIDASDSYFAVDAPAHAKGSRRYVGLMSPSASHATLLVRTYAALLQAAAELDAPDEVRDAYWTLLGYFNSLRVLGAAYIQSIDDVRDRVKVIARRHGSEPRDTRSPRELTSRVKSSDIPEELSALATSYPSRESPDVVLATNMISVGVDVDRLGLMAVMGQPQTTAEYIQATSRVGRRHPGLVFTMYNASRSRDLSHYEDFTTYHRTLYKQVEATGATPFAARALDRGLHGLLVALARHTIAGAASEAAVDVASAPGALDAVRTVVLDRITSVVGSGQASAHLVAEVDAALDELVEQWAAGVDSGVSRYSKWRETDDPKKRSLLIPAGGAGFKDFDGEPITDMFPPRRAPWPTLTSLRNVDRESTLRIVRRNKSGDR